MNRRSFLAAIPAALAAPALAPSLPAILRRRDAAFATPAGPAWQALAEAMLPPGGVAYRADCDLSRARRPCVVREWKDGEGYHRAIVG